MLEHLGCSAADTCSQCDAHRKGLLHPRGAVTTRHAFHLDFQFNGVFLICCCGNLVYYSTNADRFTLIFL